MQKTTTKEMNMKTFKMKVAVTGMSVTQTTVAAMAKTKEQAKRMAASFYGSHFVKVLRTVEK